MACPAMTRSAGFSACSIRSSSGRRFSGSWPVSLSNAKGLWRSTARFYAARSTAPAASRRIGLLVDREAVERESKRLVTRLKIANLRQTATIEDLNTRAARGLDKALFAKLATGDWIGRRHDLLITGKPARAR